MEVANLASLARLDQLTLAIGEDRFAGQLIATIRALTSADHVMAFSYSAGKPPRLVLNAGGLDEAATGRAATAYAGSLYLLDPNYNALRRIADGETQWFASVPVGPGDHLHEAFIEACGIGDVVAAASQQNGVLFYLMVLRAAGQSFAAGQRWLFEQLGETVLANVHKHFAYMYAVKGHNQFVIDRVIAEAPAFATLTPRERRVCLGILTGYTSESIGMNLEISVNSVLTYRKRLYDKLDISSQNELFMKVINAMMELSAGDPSIVGRAGAHRPLEPAKATGNERFNQYYMAEAFISDDMI